MALTQDGQLRYMMQWFEEWSELQRSDFVPILAEKLLNGPNYMNGVVNISKLNLNNPDKPMSLFECRVKLFNEWYEEWSSDMREKFLTKLEELDKEFYEKLQDDLKNLNKNQDLIPDDLNKPDETQLIENAA